MYSSAKKSSPIRSWCLRYTSVCWPISESDIPQSIPDTSVPVWRRLLIESRELGNIISGASGGDKGERDLTVFSRNV